MDSIFHRISVRRYEDKQVEKEKLIQILRAGMQAPSACNQQPWEFYVVTNPEKIKALSKATPYAGCAASAPVVIVPVYRKEGLIAPDFAQIDLSIAQENMWLETDAQGLGGVWIGIAPMEEQMEEVHKLLELPKEVAVVFFPVCARISGGKPRAGRSLPSGADSFSGVKQSSSADVSRVRSL